MRLPINMTPCKIIISEKGKIKVLITKIIYKQGTSRLKMD